MIRAFRHTIWLRHPFAHNHLLDFFLHNSLKLQPDWVVANGDYSCDTRFIGVSDPASLESAGMALGKIRDRHGARFRAVLGDHELGKTSLAGEKGGPRLASYAAACEKLHLEPFWKLCLGPYVVLGITSTLAAWDIYEPEALSEERPQWTQLQHQHNELVSEAFTDLRPEEKVVLFCHDPSALPFLWRLPAVRQRMEQIEISVIGHLHTHLVFWKSRVLAGMPAIRCLGTAIRRMSTALREARQWQPFKPKLCPSLAGSELLKDGAYASLVLDLSGRAPAQFSLHSVPRSGTAPKPR